MNRTTFGLTFFVTAIFLLAGCSGLPDSLVQEAKFIPENIKMQEAHVAAKKKEFDALDQNGEWDFISPYLKKENWEDYFTNSSSELAATKDLYTNEILPMMDRDDPKEGTKLTLLIQKFKKQIALSKDLANKTEKRISFLILSRDFSADVYKSAKAQKGSINQNKNDLITKAEKAIKDYPQKTEDLNSRIDKINSIAAEGMRSMKHVSRQFFAISTGNTDYALFGDEAVKVSNILSEIEKYKAENISKIEELYKSYTKVLADQRVEYFVVISRSSWCETDYCGSGTTRQYPPSQVDEKMFEYFDTAKVDTIVTLRSSWGSQKFKINIDAAAWDALKIDKTWSWPSGDNYADYWVEKTYATTYHKYVEIVDDRMTEGKWAKVSEDSFWNNYDNLGMAILSKPYGYYESDTLKDAQPVGMAMIAKPAVVNGVASGSNQYGEWRQSSGGSFWHYYGMYRLFGDFIGPSRYRYNDWSGYNNHRRGGSYYGRNGEYGTWGSGTYRNNRYRDSDFAKRNPKKVTAARSGRPIRSSRADSSVRGAGSSGRSRGPAGGGK